MSVEQVSLASVGLEDAGIVGALLERQLQGLESHSCKEGVKGVAQGLLRAVLETYIAEMPVRRARLLLKCLDLAYHCDLDAWTGESPQAMAEEVGRLLATQVTSLHSFLHGEKQN